jgi:2-isopropylmalate synthase
VVVDHAADGEVVAQATVKVHVAGERVIATAEGNGPVNALDGALRQALGAHVPWLDAIELSDYKVRILPGSYGTDAVTRVLVETSDGTGSWTTVGVHGNVVEASWLALLDSLTYAALRHQEWERVGTSESSGLSLK